MPRSHAATTAPMPNAARNTASRAVNAYTELPSSRPITRVHATSHAIEAAPARTRHAYKSHLIFTEKLFCLLAGLYFFVDKVTDVQLVITPLIPVPHPAPLDKPLRMFFQATCAIWV